MPSFPAFDAHAHIDSAVSSADMRGLGAGVLAATRSLDEAAAVARRRDDLAIWGVGLHPGLVKAQRQFDAHRFETLLAHSMLVSEVGIDGGSRVPMEVQAMNFRTILEISTRLGSVVSVHSSGATAAVIQVIEETGATGVVLHWWLGSPSETRRAVEHGCFFSINASSKSLAIASEIPRSRILTETDHPFGDRSEGRAARPGNVRKVEAALADQYATTSNEVRRVVWANFGTLVGGLPAREKLPGSFQRVLESV